MEHVTVLKGDEVLAMFEEDGEDITGLCADGISLIVDGEQLNEARAKPKQRGWICPKCGRAISPDYVSCPFCDRFDGPWEKWEITC